MDLDWTARLVEQLDWHWCNQLRPRLDGLTDEEYFDEPVPGCWNVRPRGTSSAPVQGGSGEFVIEFASPAPEPAPVTTIALVLHIHREVIHHGAEVALLRDLYRHRR